MKTHVVFLTLFLFFVEAAAFSSAPFHGKRNKLNAGPDQTILAGAVVHLKGSVHHVRHYAWKSSGTGRFSDPRKLKTRYYPSAQDISSGKVVITLYDLKNRKRSDQLIVTIVPSCNNVNIELATDTLCGFDTGVAYYLDAQVTGTGYYVQWTTNGGGYFYEENAASTTYEASPGDTGSGSVTLKISVYDSAGRCPVVSDSLFLKLNDPARVNLPDESFTVCGDEPFGIAADVSGTATQVSFFAAGSGHFSEVVNSAAYYYPSAEDRVRGEVTIYAVTNDPPGECGAGSDEFSIMFYGSTVVAGPDQQVCSSAGSVTVDALSNTASSVNWTTNGTGYFDDPTAFNTVYFFTDEDVSAGSIELYATVSDVCSPFTDSLIVDFSHCADVTARATADSVFPNPASTTLYIDSSMNAAVGEVVLKDAYGNHVPIKWVDANSIDVVSLASGVYYIQFRRADGAQVATRFVKK
jgi:hypothetical protein